MLLRHLALVALWLVAICPRETAAIGPRIVSQEEILEMVDNWLYNFDDDEDGKIGKTELGGLLDMLREQSSMPAEGTGALTPDLLMNNADGDGDKKIDRPELIDLLKRMKGFDAGHVKREDAQKPKPIDHSEGKYGMAHDDRMKKKKKRKGKKSATKDEV